MVVFALLHGLEPLLLETADGPILAGGRGLDHKLEDGGVAGAPHLNTGVRPRYRQ